METVLQEVKHFVTNLMWIMLYRLQLLNEIAYEFKMFKLHKLITVNTS